MGRWYERHGRWWMAQACLDGWFSLGIHLDLKHRQGDNGPYGPYVDLHVGCVILSFGYHPYLSGDLERCISVSRGGVYPDGEGNLYGVGLTVVTAAAAAAEIVEQVV